MRNLIKIKVGSKVKFINTEFPHLMGKQGRVTRIYQDEVGVEKVELDTGNRFRISNVQRIN